MKFALKNLLTLALSSATAIALTACGSGEPSIADINEAMVAAKMSDKKGAESIVKIGCKEDGKNAYRCDVGPKDGKGMVLPLRFVKTDAGWRMTP